MLTKIKILLSSTLCILALNLSGQESFAVDAEFGNHFAKNWIESWNSHDLNKILEHYTDDFEMVSPNIVRMGLNTNGRLVGKQQVGDYWDKALKRFPNLHFTLIDTLLSIDSITLYYRNQSGNTTAEIFYFDSAGKVYKSSAHYRG